MRECERHPSDSQPGGGVCALCLEERLAWLWRGESFRHDNDMVPQPLRASSSTTTSTATTATTTGLVAVGNEEAPGAPSLASVRQQLQVLGVARGPERDHVTGVSSDESNSKVPTNSTPIIEEWAAFHALRRRRSNHSNNVEGLEVDSKSESSSTDERRSVLNPELRILMNAHKMRSQSMPLDFRSAEETAARVINECRADEDYLEGDELEIYEPAVAQPTSHELQRCFSPKWQSPKWVKVLASPMTSRNRVFPSRSKDNSTDHLRKRSRSHKRGARLDSSDWGFGNASTNGGSSPLWRANSTTKSRSVFSWLQDAETTQYKKYDVTEQLTSSSSSLTNSDSWLRDLTTVGHLHEIAEELEIVEESSEEEEEEEEEERLEDLGDVSSFGKFLLQAAQRHPTNAHLTRLVSAP